MFHTDIIDKAFAELIFSDKIHRQLDMNSDAITQVRHKLKTGKTISLDYKIKLLQRSGYRIDPPQFTRKDLVAAVKFALKTSAAARQLGPEYVVQKWMAGQDV